MEALQSKRLNDFGKKGWAIILFTLLIYLFSSVPNDTLNVTAEFFALHLGMQTSNALLVFSAVGGFAGVAVSLIFGWIISKYRVKRPSAILFLIYGVLWLVNGQVNSFLMYGLVVTLLTAFSNTLNLITTQQIMNNWFPKKKGVALGWATAGMPISGAVMVAVFQKMILGIDLSAPFYLMFAICIAMALLFALWFKNYPEEAGAYPDNEPISEEEQRKNLVLISSYRSPFTVGRLFRTGQFWLIIVIFGFLFMGLVGLLSQMVPRLMVVGLDQNGAILWLTIASLVGIPMSYVWGVIDQKIGTKRAVMVFALLWTVMMALSAVGSGLNSLSVSIISVVFLSCLHGGMANLMPSLIIQIFGRYDFAQANKLITPIVVGIRWASLIVIPLILEIAGVGNEAVGYRNVFLVFTVLSLISFLASVILKSRTIGRTD